MVGDYMSTSFTGDGKAHPVFATAKAPTGSMFAQRAATATFDITAMQVGPRCVQARTGCTAARIAGTPSSSPAQTR